VGDGVDKPFYEESVQKRNIPNVSFEGQQDPLTYYQNASIFMMTSACEGLPMTILEAQQCGCVPILYDSFASAKDIIDNGVNGIMITNNDRENFVQKLKELMSNPTMRHQMSKACVQSSENYSIERVAAQWNELILSL
jgi:glycosyltransferase involved in cell wall biosynthesis